MHIQTAVLVQSRLMERVVILEVLMCCGDPGRASVVAVRRRDCLARMGYWGVGAAVHRRNTNSSVPRNGNMMNMKSSDIG
jgi:hypothetical protein